MFYILGRECQKQGGAYPSGGVKWRQIYTFPKVLSPKGPKPHTARGLSDLAIWSKKDKSTAERAAGGIPYALFRLSSSPQNVRNMLKL